MPIEPFKLERFFARYEFSVKYLLSSSDCESLTLSELLQMASPESLQLWQNLKLSYTESAGHPLLRTEISRGYAQIKPENVMIAVPEDGQRMAALERGLAFFAPEIMALLKAPPINHYMKSPAPSAAT